MPCTIFEHFFSQFQLVLTLKISLINFIGSNRPETVVLSTDYIFHNLQDDVEFDINHKLRRHFGGA